jgi:uncharacterized membrane protein YfcA
MPVMPTTVRAAVLGLAAGVTGGLFGVGGGIVVVPGLVLWFAMEQHRAHATSVAAIVATAAAALVPFAVAGEVDWLAAAALAGGSAVGAYLGARWMSLVSPLWLARGFVVLLVAAAVRLFFA